MTCDEGLNFYERKVGCKIIKYLAGSISWVEFPKAHMIFKYISMVALEHENMLEYNHQYVVDDYSCYG